MRALELIERVHLRCYEDDEASMDEAVQEKQECDQRRFITENLLALGTNS